ncbi:ORF052 [Infectious spleen and kidney necrosis virus]|uniref:ORF053R n=3 Tax=Infectious spleen and kidney necrosis virus TaxID=180170 RepID=Q8QUQ7_ISKNN|nr:ORF053R [Infectious spleen and kidney necrosis virus]QIQ54495.1 ORF051 [Angelfish iridovirus AFIV-16]QOE77191.1 hypothetical protein [Banggai cardinalfish iridovirus]AAL98777.1 ORF053R [Infectious spleen and kidney necrosis virus]QPO16300.1 hypothetical protein [Infectious spleen and kidney necrosis virus]QPO16420.1 hypothetical protein [Infectious spleen and kidney necrosis virus]
MCNEAHMSTGHIQINIWAASIADRPMSGAMLISNTNRNIWPSVPVALSHTPTVAAATNLPTANQYMNSTVL